MARSGDTRYALGYCRISTDLQEAGVSLETQAEQIAAYCVGQGLELVETVREVHSGTKLSRTKLDAVVIPAVEKRQIDCLVVYDQDRWFRDEYGRLKLERELLAANGVELLIINEGTFAKSEDRDLIRGVKGNVAQYMARQIRSKIIDAMTSKARRAEYMGGVVPYGYRTKTVSHRVDRRGKKKPVKTLEPDPAEAKIVLFICELYGLGHSNLFPLPSEWSHLTAFGSSTITDVLNALGLKQRSGRPWSTFMVKKILRDEHDRLLGTFSYNKAVKETGRQEAEREQIVTRGAYPAIVPIDLHDVCQAKLAGNSASRGRGRARSRSPYLGSGLFHDAACGGKLLGRTRGPSGRHRLAHRYMCENRYNKKGCDTKMIPASHLDRSLEAVVEAFFASAANRAAVLAAAQARLGQDDGLAVVQGDLRQARRELDNLKANLRAAPALGPVIQGDVLAAHDRVRKLEAAERRLKLRQGVDREEQFERLRAMVDGFLGIWRGASVAEKNRALRALVESAEVDVDNKTVNFKLAIPLELNCIAVGQEAGDGGRGCMRLPTEVHGNRTRRPLAFTRSP